MTLLRSIMVPLDGSPFAEHALALAETVAQAARARLRLALVHQSPPAPVTPDERRLYTAIELATRRAERNYLSGLVKRLKEEGHPDVTRVVLTGKPASALAEHAAEWGASLMVMSTHGRGPLSRAWLGSVADQLIRSHVLPVLLVRPRVGNTGPDVFKLDGRFLVPLDGSTLSEAALEPAAAIARLFGAELHLLQVLRPVPIEGAGGISFPGTFDGRIADLWREAAQTYLDRVVERLRTEGVRASAEVLLSEGVAGPIIDLAGAKGVRLVALATHGRSGVRRLTLGSVADKVVRGVDLPVLVCPRKAGVGRSRGREQ